MIASNVKMEGVIIQIKSNRIDTTATHILSRPGMYTIEIAVDAIEMYNGLSYNERVYIVNELLIEQLSDDALSYISITDGPENPKIRTAIQQELERRAK